MDSSLSDIKKMLAEMSPEEQRKALAILRFSALSAMGARGEAPKTKNPKNPKNPVTGLATGFIDLDRMTTGLHSSDYVLVAARPSMGKTALALNIIQNAVFRDGKSAAIFSLEMSRGILMNLLFAQESRVDIQNIRTGSLSSEDWGKLLESTDTIGQSNLIIDDTPGISVSELRSKCLKFKLEHGLDLVVIDYLQLMSGSSKVGENRRQEISDISRGIKALARELDIPIIVLSQLSRALELRYDKRPMMSDFESGVNAAQDADIVMFLYRDEYYNKDTDAKGIAELIIGKQRNGPVGTIQLIWMPNYFKFANMNKERRE